MRQRFTISRRKAVALVAGSLAATVGPAASDLAARPVDAMPAEAADSVTLYVHSRRRLLELLQEVRRVRGSARTRTFGRFVTALRARTAAESLQAREPSAIRRGPEGSVTTLYRHREFEPVLADVIVRELEAMSQSDAMWMTRFADLEAVIHARAFA